LAIDQLKLGVDTQTYTTTVSRAVEMCGLDALGPAYALDAPWIGVQNRLAIEKQTKLESAYQLTKRDDEIDPTRKCLEAVARHLMDRGDYHNAVAKYLEARQAGFTNNVQKIQNALDIIEGAIAMGSYLQVKKQHDYAKRLPGLSEHPLFMAKLNAAHGLCFLKEGQFASAARAFLSVTIDIKDKFKEVIAAEDIVDYACMCALASFSRQELFRMLEREEFRKLLELRPMWPPIIQAYLTSKYSLAFRRLADMEPEFQLDIHLHRHSARIIALARDRAIVQYTRPFASVRIPHIAKMFDVEVQVMEAQLANLIADGQIEARIDSTNKVVYARSADARSSTFQHALSVGSSYSRNVRSLLMRMSLAEQDISVRFPMKDKGGKKEDGLND